MNAGYGGRHHPLQTLRRLRKGLWLCLIPLARAALAGRWGYLWLALWQDTFWLAALALYGAHIHRRSGWLLTRQTLLVWRGTGLQTVYRREAFIGCEVSRTLWLRLLGAARLRLFFAAAAPAKSVTLYLRRRDAAALSNALFPLPAAQLRCRPTGGGRLAFIMLGANITAETALVLHAASRLRKALGTALSDSVLHRLGAWLQTAGVIAPVGLSLAASLVFLCTLWGFAASALRSCGYQVGRAGGLLISRGGLFTRVERRLRADRVQWMDIRRSPLARVLGVDAVYIGAGGAAYQTPFLFLRRRRAGAPHPLLPLPAVSTALPRRYARRALGQFIGLPAGVLAVCLLFFTAALRTVPVAAPILGVGAGFCLVWLAAQLQAFFCEGFAVHGGQAPSPALPGREERSGIRRPADGPYPVVWLCYTGGLTRHFVSVRPDGCRFTVRSTSTAALAGRADVLVRLPTGRRLRVRGVALTAAQALLTAVVGQSAVATPAPADKTPGIGSASPAADKNTPVP